MNKETVLREFIAEVWNNQRKDLVSKYIAEEYHIHLDTADPWEGKTLNHEAFKNRLDFSFNSFPDMHFEITSAIEDDNHVSINWILTGTNLGSIGDFPATKNKVKARGMTIYQGAFQNDAKPPF